MKTIVIRATKTGNSSGVIASIYDDRNNLIEEQVSKKDLIVGKIVSVEDNVKVIFIKYSGINGCCNKEIRIPVTQMTKEEYISTISTVLVDRTSMWKHLTTTTLYNNFYNCIHPYVLDYPFVYQQLDEIAQSIKDYTKVYTYFVNKDKNNKVQTDEVYFNQAVIYNDQQSSGNINLVAKPIGNMKEYMKYPKITSDSISLLFTKSDNFYQFNGFYNTVKDKQEPLFNTSCTSLSVDKEINQSNMSYINRGFKKDNLRAKDLNVRLILNNRSDSRLVSQFIITESQLSHK